MTPATQALIDKANESDRQLTDVRGQYEAACDACRAIEAQTNDLWHRFQQGDNTVCDEMRTAFAKLDKAHDHRRASHDPISKAYDARRVALNKATEAVLLEVGLTLRDEDPLTADLRRTNDPGDRQMQGQAPT